MTDGPRTPRQTPRTTARDDPGTDTHRGHRPPAGPLPAGREHATRRPAGRRGRRTRHVVGRHPARPAAGPGPGDRGAQTPRTAPARTGAAVRPGRAADERGARRVGTGPHLHAGRQGDRRVGRGPRRVRPGRGGPRGGTHRPARGAGPPGRDARGAAGGPALAGDPAAVRRARRPRPRRGRRVRRRAAGAAHAGGDGPARRPAGRDGPRPPRADRGAPRGQRRRAGARRPRLERRGPRRPGRGHRRARPLRGLTGRRPCRHPRRVRRPALSARPVAGPLRRGPGPR
ncbi:hypothetical protein STENM327S_02207 [Streptomyces tendae]